MKKCYLCISLIIVMLLSGCSASKILYPSVPKADLYYNTVEFITKTDVRSGLYDDLFLPSFVALDSTQEYIINCEQRQLSGQVVNFVDFLPKATNENELCSWLSNTICQYGFIGPNERENKISYYLVQNTVKNTYNDYLNVMKALTTMYGECTTEIYKKDGYSINNTSVSEDTDDTQQLIEKYNEAYENGEITIESRWVGASYVLSVVFADDGTGRVTYVFK